MRPFELGDIAMRKFRAIRLAGMAASLVLSVWGTHVEAVSIPILNSSFELPDAAGGFVDGVSTNWTGVSADGDLYSWVESSASITFTGGDGPQHSGMGEEGYIYQDLGVAFQANKTYRIDLAGAHRAGFGHATLQFGLFSSTAIGTALGTPGFIDLAGIWSGSGNPDADDVFNTLRDASVLQKIDLSQDGKEMLGRVYEFSTGASPPAGNIVAFIRHQGNGERIQYDNIRLDELPTLQKGDVDGDGDVDLDDLSDIQSNFRTSVASRALGDLNDDGFVDFTDYLEWKAYFPFPGAGAGGGMTNSATAPEPSSVLGLAVGLFALCRLRRARRSTAAS
jgi:hypothetical protein